MPMVAFGARQRGFVFDFARAGRLSENRERRKCQQSQH